MKCSSRKGEATDCLPGNPIPSRRGIGTSGQLELSQIEERNNTLTKDNAKLLQRWLDAKQAEVNKMNEANEFYEDMQSRRQAVNNWRIDSGSNADDKAEVQSLQESESGNEEAQKESRAATTTDGIASPAETATNQTPNG